MRRLLIAILFMFFLAIPAMAELSKGTMVMVYPKRPISTDAFQENDFVYFVNPADVWLGDKNVFPKNHSAGWM